jgi:Mg-chelatase subunit ChlD
MVAVKKNQQKKAGGKNPFNKMHFQLDCDDGSRSVTVENKQCQLCFAASVDVSGSMSGSRIKTAIKGLEAIVHGMMRPEDLFGLVTFNTEVKNLHKPMPKRKVNWSKDKEHILKNVGGRTALWDAVQAGIVLLKEVLARRKTDPDRRGKAKLVFEQLVITDGLDNSSSVGLEQLKALVTKPGLPDYHLRIIAVTSDMEASEILLLEQLCRPAHATLLRVSDVQELQAVLKAEAQRLTLLLQETNAQGHTRRREHNLQAGTGSDIFDLSTQQLTGMMKQFVVK